MRIGIMNSEKGFSLMELMVVVAIIGLIVSIGYPSYTGYMQKTRRADGVAALNHAAMVMESCRSDLATYVGCDADPRLPGQSEKGNYDIVASGITASGYTLTATAVGVQAKDGKCATLTLNAQGVKGYTGTAPDLAACWGR
jgi:type IV pilus assembly protein PilE